MGFSSLFRYVMGFSVDSLASTVTGGSKAGWVRASPNYVTAALGHAALSQWSSELGALSTTGVGRESHF